MKAKVIIEDSRTVITLTPENDFDRDMVEKLYENSHKINTSVLAEPGVYNSFNHRIVLTITKD